MVEHVRLRLVFQDAGILSGSQRRRRLQRCWLQLQPGVATIADLASQLHRSFRLHRSCPHGLIISMDEFVVPPFLSTCILKDGDIIRINKNGVIFKDVAKFCDSQNQEQILQSSETLAFNNRNLTIMDSLVSSKGDENDTVFCNGSAVHMETAPNEKRSAQCKRKRSIKLLVSDITLDNKDSDDDSLGDVEDICHGSIAHQETMSNKIVKLNRYLSIEFQTSNTLSNKDSLAYPQEDKRLFCSPVLHKESSSSEMMQVKKWKKCNDRIQGLNDTLTPEDCQESSQRDDQGVDPHVHIVCRDATSLEMMTSKHQSNYSKLQASDTLTTKNSEGDCQGEDYLDCHSGDKSPVKNFSCETTNIKRRKKLSKRHQGSDDILANKDSHGEPQVNRFDVGIHGKKLHKKITTNEEKSAKHKKKHSNKHHSLEITLATAICQEHVPEDEEDLDLSNSTVSPTKSRSEMTNVKRLNPSENYKNGAISKDVANFGCQNQEQVIKSRETSAFLVGSKGNEKDNVLYNGSAVHMETRSSEMNPLCKGKHFNNSNLAITDSSVGSKGDENDNTLYNGSAVHMEIPPNEMNPQGKGKHSNKDSYIILDAKDYSGGSPGDEDEEEIMARQGTTSNEMVIAKGKKKLSRECQTLNNLSNKKFQACSQEGKGLFTLPIIHMEMPTEMIQENEKTRHNDRIQGLNDALAPEDSQENSLRDEHDVGLHVNVAQKEAISLEVMNSHKRKYSKLQASDTLMTKKSEGDLQEDDNYLGHLNGDKAGKKYISNIHQGSDDILAIKISGEDSQDPVGVHGNKLRKGTTKNEKMSAKHKKKHSNKNHTSVSTVTNVKSHEDARGDEDLDVPNDNVSIAESPSEMNYVIKRLKPSEKESKVTNDGNALKKHTNGDAKKVMNRSTRRKKAKKRWFRTQNLKEEEEPSEPANAAPNTKEAKSVIPVIVGPGHIRFESSDESNALEDDMVEILQWNGTTSKKKGQKWGLEKNYHEWNDDTSSHMFSEEYNYKEAVVVDITNEKPTIEEMDGYKSYAFKQVESATDYDENCMAKDLKEVKQLVDFESFLPLLRLPEEDDVLIYRVVELSSSWCPELSPFRVGRVSSYDSITSKIILLPHPEYPILFEEMPCEGQESCSLYNEDGTLEIDFTYLVDVRLFKSPELEGTTLNALKENQNVAPAGSQESESYSDHTGTEQQLSDGWEAINRAINEKKAQLHKQCNVAKTNSSKSTGPWSYKALRRNALGPTLAMLRNCDGGGDGGA